MLWEDGRLVVEDRCLVWGDDKLVGVVWGGCGLVGEDGRFIGEDVGLGGEDVRLGGEDVRFVRGRYGFGEMQ